MLRDKLVDLEAESRVLCHGISDRISYFLEISRRSPHPSSTEIHTRFCCIHHPKEASTCDGLLQCF